MPAIQSEVHVISKAVSTKRRRQGKGSRKAYRLRQKQLRAQAKEFVGNKGREPFIVRPTENQPPQEEGKPKSKTELAREAARKERQRAVEEANKEVESKIRTREYLKSIGTDQNRLQFK